MQTIKYLFVAILMAIILGVSSGCALFEQKESSKSITEYVADSRAVLAGVIVTIGDMVQARIITPDEAQSMLDQAVAHDNNMRNALTLIQAGKIKEGEDLYTKSYTSLIQLRSYLYSRQKGTTAPKTGFNYGRLAWAPM